ncbi:MAG: 16S rRNA (cytosine(1402)-N(4))-methyltransferase RsmH [Planctomycetota bacterium]
MHQSVLIEEVIKYLAPLPGDVVIDATIGLGGHSQIFIEKIKPNGRLIGIDLDKESISQAQERLKPLLETASLDLFSDNFANTGNVLEKLGLKGADVILLDLGISSYQIEASHRGFSFMKDAPLDMRMSQDSPLDASKVVNNYSADDLIEIFKSYGEERFAKRIVQKIVNYRQKKPITTTFELVGIIKNAAPCGWQRIHPATRVFQALRIEVNKELDNLKTFLSRVTNWLNPHGRVGIISFHSLEDRLVKEYFRNYYKEGVVELVTKKPIGPAPVERANNPRSRSAKLRVAIKK